MPSVVLQDHEIQNLLECPKTLSENNRKKLSTKKLEGACQRADIRLGSDRDDCSFFLRTREALDDQTDFSVILSIQLKTGERFNLMRCNGSSHNHTNALERETICGTHIHIATERYMRLGSSAERYATATQEYRNLESAILHLMELANINFFISNSENTIF